MNEGLARRIEEHLDDFAEYERPDASQLPEDRERALEARVAAVGVVLDAIDAAGYKVMSRELAEKLRTNNNERLERIRVLERQVRESEADPAADDSSVTRAKMSNPVSRVQTAGRMLADLKNKADASRAEDVSPESGSPDDVADGPAEGYEARDAKEVVEKIIAEEDAREGESSSAKVRCCECGYYGPWQEFPAAGSPYHDLRCPKCSTTNLDTSECLAEDSGYGYGTGNTLESM